MSDVLDVELPPVDPEEANVFKLENSPFELSLRIDNFADDKEQIKFIKAVEKMVRFSPEYKLWVNYIVETLGQNKCEFTGESKCECPVDVHHHPICLFTIVKSLIDDKIKKHESFCTFDIARETIELHFQNKVGYVLILSSLHEKYHNGFLQIPIEFVSGDFRYILQRYEMDREEYDRILLLCSIHKDDVVQSWSRNSYPGITNNSDDVKEIELKSEDILTTNNLTEKIQSPNITDNRILDMLSVVE